MQPPDRSLAATLAELPPEWPADPLPAIRAAVRAADEMLVVLDDDPTGTQSVHGISVLTEWSVDALRAELDSAMPAVYLLTNSRSMPLAQAQALNAEIGRNIQAAAQPGGRRPVVVSRSDSTLRGHFPGEVDALAAALGGGFDATLLIPAFIAGGRYTIDDVHYVADGDRLIPAGETDFARDATFGYRASNLREWVAEQTGGRVPAAHVAAISIETIRRAGPDGVADQLAELHSGGVCVINAASERDLAVAALGMLQAEARGKRFLYRTAASIVPLRAGIRPRPLLARADLDLPAAALGPKRQLRRYRRADRDWIVCVEDIGPDRRAAGAARRGKCRGGCRRAAGGRRLGSRDRACGPGGRSAAARRPGYRDLHQPPARDRRGCRKQPGDRAARLGWAGGDCARDHYAPALSAGQGRHHLQRHRDARPGCASARWCWARFCRACRSGGWGRKAATPEWSTLCFQAMSAGRARWPR